MFDLDEGEPAFPLIEESLGPLDPPRGPSLVNTVRTAEGEEGAFHAPKEEKECVYLCMEP